MRSIKHLVLISGAMLAVACGGSAPPAAAPQNSTAPANASNSSNAVNLADLPPASASTVRFDDLGVSFVVPPGMRVIGDDELSSEIRTSANARVSAALKDRAAQGKGLPLLTLASEKSTAANRLGLTLAVAVVPDDAKVSELMDHQLGVLKENLSDFALAEGPTDKTVDGIAGSEVVDSYVLGEKGTPKTHARMRVFVRKGRAFVLTTVWPETAPPETETQARALMDGLHFYEPTP